VWHAWYEWFCGLWFVVSLVCFLFFNYFVFVLGVERVYWGVGECECLLFVDSFHVPNYGSWAN
jgi:hypothetical protein